MNSLFVVQDAESKKTLGVVWGYYECNLKRLLPTNCSMAQSLYDVEAIIKKSYSLQVAVRCTTSADALCMKNQLTFCELVEPFCHLSSPGKQSLMDDSTLFIRARISYIIIHTMCMFHVPYHVFLARFLYSGFSSFFIAYGCVWYV